MTFITADIRSEWERASLEEQELALLGMMILSNDNYNKVTVQITDDDLVHYKDFFRAIHTLYEKGDQVDFNTLADLCEELEIIPKGDSIQDDNGLWKLTTNEGLQTISKMIACSDSSYNVQLFIDLLKSKDNTPPSDIGGATCKEKYINTHIYTQGEACNGENEEILASNRYTQRYTSVTDRDTSLQSSESESPLSKRIGNWIEETTAWFTSNQLDSELAITTKTEKANRRLIIKRLCDKGTLQRHHQQEGKYRYVNTTIDKLDLKAAAPTGIDIKLPFKIEDYVKLYPGNVIVVAGAANAGKTAFMLNVIRMNLDNYANRIRYFCSEGGAEELRGRLDMFPMSDDDLDKFEAVKKTANFADAIVPDWINVIDFLEMSTDLWLVNDHLTAIQNKLTTGIGIVAIQKKKDAYLGRGAEFGLEKPKLYVTMDAGVLEIIKAKDWRDKKVNPNGMTAEFKLVKGCEFLTTKPLSAKNAPRYNTQMKLTKKSKER